MDLKDSSFNNKLEFPGKYRLLNLTRPTVRESSLRSKNASREKSMTPPFPHLSDEIWLQIFSWIPPVDLMQSVVHVSKHISSLISTKSYWKSHAQWFLQGLGTEAIALLNTHQLQRLSVYGASRSGMGKRRPPDCLLYGSLLVSRPQGLRQRDYGKPNERANQIFRRVCIASSSHHSFEMLENTLSYGRQTWWCSRPAPTSHSNDTLVFVTNCPLALITKIYVRPMVYPYTEDRVFTWQTTEIKAYRLPLHKVASTIGSVDAGFPCTIRTPDSYYQVNTDSAVDSNRERAAIDALFQDENPVYESGNIPVQHRTYPVGQGPVMASREVFDLSSSSSNNTAVLANAISITLNGKDMQEPGTEEYFAGVEQVVVEGVPLLSHSEQRSLLQQSRGSEDEDDDGRLMTARQFLMREFAPGFP